MRGNRILVIQLERLGDLVQTTPLILDLRRADSQAQIELLAWSEFAPVVEGLPGVTLRTLASRRVKELDEEVERARSAGHKPDGLQRAASDIGLSSYDFVINVSHGPFASWLASRVEAKNREGGVLNDAGEWLYAGDWLTFFVALAQIPRDNRFNIVDLYRGCAGAGPATADAHAHVSCAASLPFDIPQGRFAALAPGANEPHRQFDRAETLQLFPQLTALGLEIVLVGGPAEREFAGALRSASPVPVCDLAGKTNVQQLAEVLRRAEVVIAADSGPAHIAAALGRPLVGLYGASLSPFTTAPWGEGHIVLVGNNMEVFASDLVMAAIRMRLGLHAGEDLRREAVARGVEAWRTVMLPPDADPLGGVTYRPLHTDVLDGAEIQRRLMRHVMARIIMKKEAGGLSYMRGLVPEHIELDSAGKYEEQLMNLAAEVGRAVAQIRKRRLDGLNDLADRVAGVIDHLRRAAANDAAAAPAILFLDWKLRTMPAYVIDRVFQEYEREIRRAAKALKLAREAAAQLQATS